MPIDIRHSREISAEERLQDAYDLAVVIDVIRAFTVAPWILRQGAARLLLSPDKATALQAKAGNFPEAVLVSDGAPDARFELPNAPGQVAHHDLTGRVVIQTTGNGTRGAHLVRHVPTVACASFVTASATAELVAQFDRVLLVPTDGDEDYALADYLSSHAQGAAFDISALMDRVRRSAAGVECLDRGGDHAYPGVHPDDLARCMTLDAFSQALVLTPQGALLSVEAR